MPATSDALPRLIRAWLLAALSDGLFSTVLVIVFYHSTFARLWQGVASVLLGPDAMTGGTRTVLIGLLMHLTVALTWTAIFLGVVMKMGWVQSLLASPYGVVKVSALYGPFIWLVMSLAVIPIVAHRAPAPISIRWTVQLVGHIVFVALPMIWSLTRGSDSRA